jgi:hypothetical protein
MTTTSLDLSKKLVETAERVGFNLPDSEFVYAKSKANPTCILMNGLVKIETYRVTGRWDIIPAFTLDELLAIMPFTIFIGEEDTGIEEWEFIPLKVEHADGKNVEYYTNYYYNYDHETATLFGEAKYHTNLADCVCELLIWLLDNDFLK